MNRINNNRTGVFMHLFISLVISVSLLILPNTQATAGNQDNLVELAGDASNQLLANQENILFSEDWSKTVSSPVDLDSARWRVDDGCFGDGFYNACKGSFSIYAGGDNKLCISGENNGTGTLKGYWAGYSLVTVPTFSASIDKVLVIETTCISHTQSIQGGSATRAGIWLIAPDKSKWLFLGDDYGESDWGYNPYSGLPSDYPVNNPESNGYDLNSFNKIFSDCLHGELKVRIVIDGDNAWFYMMNPNDMNPQWIYGGTVPLDFKENIAVGLGVYARRPQNGDVSGDYVKGEFGPLMVSSMDTAYFTRGGVTISKEGSYTATVRISNSATPTTLTLTSSDSSILIFDNGTGMKELNFANGETEKKVQISAIKEGKASVSISSVSPLQIKAPLMVTCPAVEGVKLEDDFDDDAIDSSLWTISDDGYETGYTKEDFFGVKNGQLLVTNMRAIQNYWGGKSVLSKKTFLGTKETPLKIMVDFDKIVKSTGQAFCGGLILRTADNKHFFAVRNNRGEGGWQYNKIKGTGGTTLNVDDDNARLLELIYDGENITIFLDGVQVGNAHWICDEPLYIELGFYAREVNASGSGAINSVKVENIQSEYDYSIGTVSPTVLKAVYGFKNLLTISLPEEAIENSNVEITLTSRDPEIAYPEVTVLTFEQGGETTKSVNIVNSGDGYRTTVIDLSSNIELNVSSVLVESYVFGSIMFEDDFKSGRIDPSKWYQANLSVSSGTSKNLDFSVSEGMMKGRFEAATDMYDVEAMVIGETFYPTAEYPVMIEFDQGPVSGRGALLMALATILNANNGSRIGFGYARCDINGWNMVPNYSHIPSNKPKQLQTKELLDNTVKHKVRIFLTNSAAWFFVDDVYGGMMEAELDAVNFALGGEAQTINNAVGFSFGNVRVYGIPAPDNMIIPLSDNVNLEMVWCPAGTFIMGSPEMETGHRNNETLHEVTLSNDFWIGKYEVTEAQYKAIMGYVPYSAGDNYPVYSVSWEDANTFCERLTQVERAAGRIPMNYKYSLPTEAQWEYACRAGTTTALNSGKNLSDENECSEMDEVGWYKGNCESKFHEVGQKLPNAWGLYDMHGNVCEWCLDGWLDDLGADAVTDPCIGASSDRVRRGGCVDYSPSNCRSAYREGHDHLYDYLTLSGFRIALVPTQVQVLEKGFLVSYYQSKTMINNIQDAEHCVKNPLQWVKQENREYPMINFSDLIQKEERYSLEQHFNNSVLFSGQTYSGEDINDFVIVAKTKIFIPKEGIWSFGVLSDDGFKLEITGNGVNYAFEYPIPRAEETGDVIQSFDFPVAGMYDVRLTYFERDGVSCLEFFAARGRHSSFNSEFKLVGDTDHGGLLASLVSQKGDVITLPTITVQPESQSVTEGDSVIFSVTVEDNIGDLNYVNLNPSGVVPYVVLNDDKSYTLYAGGGDYWETSERGCLYLNEWIEGDFDAVLCVKSIEDNHQWAKVGLAFRATLAGSSPHVSMLATPSRVQAIYRPFPIGSQTFDAWPVLQDGGFVEKNPINYEYESYPSNWIRLKREGDHFTAYRSVDGKYWTFVNEGDFTTVGNDSSRQMPKTGYIGIVYTTNDQTDYHTAVVSDYTSEYVEPTMPTPDPSDFTFRIIGYENGGVDGFYDYDQATGEFQIWGCGSNVWADNDHFSYMYYPVPEGDFTFTVKLNEFLASSHYWAKAGLMLREGSFDGSFPQDSRYIAMHSQKDHFLVTHPETGKWGSSWRNAKGVCVDDTYLALSEDMTSYPGWQRIERVGDIVTCYYSQDGVNWELLSRHNTTKWADGALGSKLPLYIGMFVTSHNKDSYDACAYFSDVRLEGENVSLMRVDSSIELEGLVTTASSANITTYQWYKNGVAIDGATSPSYTIKNAKTTDVGTYTVTVHNVAGYVTSEAATLTVNIKPSVFSQPKSQTVAEGDSVTFNVTATGTAPLSYQWYKDNKEISGATFSSYTISSVNSSDAGSYTVTVSNVAGTVTSKAAVLKVYRNLTVTLVDATVVYGSEATLPAAEISGLTDGDDVTYFVTTDYSVGAPVGEYTITATAGGKDLANYIAPATVTSKLTVIPKTLKVTLADASVAYGKNATLPKAKITGLYGTDDVTYAVMTAYKAGSKVGEYTITATAGGNALSNYNAPATVTSKLTVTKKALTVTLADATVEYGKDATLPEAKISGLYGTDKVNYTVSTDYKAGDKVGEYTITATASGSDLGNYTAQATVTSKLTVTKKALTITAPSQSVTYGTDVPTMEPVIGELVGKDKVTATVTTTYVKGAKVGTYTTSIGEVTGAENYEVTKVDGTLTVTKAALTVKAEDKSVTYGDKAPIYTATYSGFIAGDDASKLSGTLAFDCTYKAGSAVNTYMITPKGLTSENYAITYQAGTLTVTAKALTVTLADATVEYGKDATLPKAQITGLYGTDDVTYTVTTDYKAGSKVGEYTITATAEGSALSNYNAPKTVTSKLTVTAKALTVTLADATVEYGKEATLPKAQISGLYGTDKVNYTVSTDYKAGDKVGEYTITATASGSDLGNYTAQATVTSKLTVTKKALTITAPSQSVTYGADVPTMEPIIGEVVGKDKVTATVTTTYTKGAKVGTYTTSIGEVTGAENYEVTKVDGTLTVTKANQTITLTMNPVALKVGESTQLSAVSTSGLDVTITISDESILSKSGEALSEGTVTITATQAGDENYNAAESVTKTVTVAAKDVLTVRVDNKTVIYGEDVPEYTYTMEPKVEEVKVDLNCTYQVDTDAGSYPITATVTGAEKYNVVVENGTLTVEKADPEVSIGTGEPEEAIQITYGELITDEITNVQANVEGAFTYEVYEIEEDNNLVLQSIDPTGTALDAGTYILKAVFMPEDAINYNEVTVEAWLIVNQAESEISWATPATITEGIALSSIQLNAIANVEGTFEYDPAEGTILEAGTHILTVMFTPDSANYTQATASVELVVEPSIVVELTWRTPEPIDYGTPLSEAQLNATANVEGQFIYNPTLGAILNAGTQKLTVIFRPANANLKNGHAEVVLFVNKAGQILTFETIGEVKQGDVFTLSASTDKQLPVRFVSSDEEIVKIEDNIATVVGSGTVTITAIQDGNENYEAVSEEQTLTISGEEEIPEISYKIDLKAGTLTVRFTCNLYESEDGITWTLVEGAKDTYTVSIKYGKMKLYRAAK